MLSIFNPHTPAYRKEIFDKIQRMTLNNHGAGAQAVHDAALIVKFKPLYDPVEAATGVPWWMVGGFDCREEGFNHRGNLCNGDPLDRPTTHVPRGVGPFATWTQGAVFAMHYDRIAANDIIGWFIEGERFNGEGYHNHSDPTAPSSPEPNPYLWSGTNIYHKGKYTGDGHWDSSVVDVQSGIAAMYLALVAMKAPITTPMGTP